MKISIIGTGYVGLVTGACLAEKGHQVTCVDINPERVAALNRAESPIFEAGLEELLRKHVGKGLSATTDLTAAVLGTELTLIAVGTPFNGNEIDLTFVLGATKQIGAALKQKSGYHVVVVKSTVVPGTTDQHVLPALEASSGKKAGKDFGVGMNPEFLSEGEAVNDFLFPDVEILNIFTGTAKPVVKNPGNVLRWVADSRGVVRAGVELNGDKLRLRYRKDARSSWKTIAESPLTDFDCWPLKFTPDDQDLFVYASNSRNTTGLYIFEVARRALGECLWQHAEFDIGSIGLTRNGKPACISYTADRLQSHWLIPEWAAIQAGIDKALPDTVNRMVSVSKDGSKAVFRSFGDRTPGAYYLYEKATHQLQKLRDIMGWINPEEMAPMRPISYVARDGLTIHGYLTLPLGLPATNLPTVIMPHGGPWARDFWGFDSQVQFLANRGYAVLQMNFRGSTGYGFAFMKAGFKQWGLKMQDDITDGVKWAIAQGITDKTRVGIFGASYGGYAAMMGLTQTPELYKCGINYAGVTDITLLLKVDAYRLPKLTGFQRLALGDAKGDRDKLEATSPINHVDKIRAPVLLIYGGQDQRVRVTQGKRLASELTKHGKQYEMIFEEKEGHGFHIEKNKIEMYRKMDAFLKKYL